MVLRLIRIDQRREYVEAIAFRGAGGRAPQPLDLEGGSFAVRLRPNWPELVHVLPLSAPLPRDIDLP
jgi:hypothetical protein